MPLLDLDPSLAVGFLCTSLASFDKLCDKCALLGTKCLSPFSITEYPPRIPYELTERDGDDDDEVVRALINRVIAAAR